MTRKATEPPLALDMPFDEALARFIQTKPEEVQPPPSRKPKGGKAVAPTKLAKS